MSWTVSTGVIDKLDAERKVNGLMITDPPSSDMNIDGAKWDQLQAAKRAALELLKTVPGPYVSVSLNGHANAIGWQSQDGSSADYIGIGVGQHYKAAAG
jgi:hypothetical protein